jgi:hypothetical protein
VSQHHVGLVVVAKMIVAAAVVVAVVLAHNHLNHLVYKQLVHLNRMDMEFDTVVVVVVLLVVNLSVSEKLVVNEM